jgi:hypothetical protein
MAVGRAGMSVDNYDVEYVPEILDGMGNPVYGRSPTQGLFRPFQSAELGPRGLPLIQITDLGLSDMNEAVATLFHEVYHQQMLAAFGWTGTEAAAEDFGQRMLSLFLARTGG